MKRRNLIASRLMACMLAAGLLGLSPAPDAASAGKSARKASGGARSYVLEGRRHEQRRHRGLRIPLPLGPAYVYYDYPYYYSRGHYPTHIGGYVYYIPGYRGRCAEWRRRCLAKAGYRGRALSRRQREACRCP